LVHKQTKTCLVFLPNLKTKTGVEFMGTEAKKKRDVFVILNEFYVFGI